MAKDLIISQTMGETRLALIENGEVLDYLIDRTSPNENHRPVVGNIYMGRVLRVLPGMQSAFVDIGTDRAAFLYVDDAYLPTLVEQRAINEKLKHQQQEIDLGGEAPEKQSAGQTIPDEFSSLSETMQMKFRPEVKIQDVLKEGDEILVQIAKEPIATKGPRITRHVSLAGRYLVYMPYIEHTGVSRRIESDKERERLKEVLDSIRPEGVGVIARTLADAQSYKTLKADFNILVKLWKDIQKKQEKARAPSVLHQDLTFVQRSLRDLTDEDVESIIVDNKSTAKQIEKFIDKYLSDLKCKIKVYQEDMPIFDYYGIEVEIERALSNKIFLRSGGSINIDQTEALVSIDVNTGKFVGKKTLEETILKTNLEAVKEIAYQLRLRNCGGIIIIDFIDMEKMEHREMVYQSLLEVLKKDRSKTNVLPISELGVVEMTRKRTRDTLSRLMCEPCSYCEGVGRVKSVQSVCFEIIREVVRTAKKTQSLKISVFAHPEVSARLGSEDMGILDFIENDFQKNVYIRADNSYHIEQYEIVTSDILDRY